MNESKAKVVRKKLTVVKKKAQDPSTVVKKRTRQKKKKKNKVTIKEALPGSPEVVERDHQAHWKEQEWRIDILRSILSLKKIYSGKYKTNYASFNGVIGDNKFYIFKPSPRILQGPHGPCFTPDKKSRLSKQKYIIHFSPYPTDMSSGIASVERTIIESYA